MTYAAHAYHIEMVEEWHGKGRDVEFVLTIEKSSRSPSGVFPHLFVKKEDKLQRVLVNEHLFDAITIDWQPHNTRLLLTKSMPRIDWTFIRNGPLHVSKMNIKRRPYKPDTRIGKANENFNLN